MATSVKKEGDNLSVAYQAADASNLTEASKLDMYLDKNPNGAHFI